MAAVTTSSANINNNNPCGGGFFNFRSNSTASRGVRHHHSHAASCSKLDGVAMWLVNGVAAAFFASLDSCSCIRIATVDDDAEDANDAPLILNDASITPPPRRRTRAKKQAAMLYAAF
ncbi:unnamed protein product [Linum trigynum]|uniref:Uncharacterized protein n=1 Tax=Linum trigynum TaxID=586398 RepID=A0AAV2CXU5_9ROSI